MLLKEGPEGRAKVRGSRKYGIHIALLDILYGDLHIACFVLLYILPPI